MVYKVCSGRVGGIFGDLITVEVDASSGLPCFEMIGLLGSEVREARERVRVSLKNNGIHIPALRITINLSPADERKEGSAFDLPIAVAMLGVLGHLSNFDPSTTLIIGELSLDGSIQPVRGILPIVKMAKDKNFKRVILPASNASEGAMIKGIDIIPVNSLSDVMCYLALPEEMMDKQIPPYVPPNDSDSSPDNEFPNFNEVVGQEIAIRAASIAASGFHHLLMLGPPGTGKSLIAKRIPGIMPQLTYEESLEVTTIYSVAGKLTNSKPFINERPFISPHTKVSPKALIGGGFNASPGLVSLSHRGILFLDEMAEFDKKTLDLLRQPLEDGNIDVSRFKESIRYPASFMLVGAMNPCPCGYYPDRNRCTCSEPAIERYISKISGPIMDRIDLCVEVSRIDPSEISTVSRSDMSSEDIRKQVEQAVAIQALRYKDEDFCFNSGVPSSKITKYIPLDRECTDFINRMYKDLNLSLRSYYKIIRVARTIADLDGSENVLLRHLAESCCYRFPDYMEK